MATYTDNYQLIKPTMAETADIRTINGNMDTIDDILHASQVSLADAYDSTKTYNTDDVVMYEFLMYKCLEDNVTGTWDATKWERTVASSSGASGSSVEPNPTGSATDTLTKLGIDGTIYGIEGSGGGGGNVYGAFIDTNRVITTLTGSGSGDTFQDYTAVEDCAVIGTIRGDSGAVQIDGSTVAYTSDSSETIGVCVYARRGQTVSYRMNSLSTLTVYGLTFGTQNIFTPQIYSTEERCVGVWIDNKPLYAKSYKIQSLPNASAFEYSLGISDIDSVAFLGCVVENSSVALPLFYNASNDNQSKIQIHLSDKEAGKVIINTFGDNRSSMSGTVVIQYTKTTDVAGSGSYNSLGVPMVHYSTDEQVIGTWEDENGIKKPLYQKLVYFNNISKNGDIPLGVTNGENFMLITGKSSSTSPLPYVHGSAPSNNIGGFFDNNGNWSLRSGNDAPSTISGFMVIQYTKTTD